MLARASSHFSNWVVVEDRFRFHDSVSVTSM